MVLDKLLKKLGQEKIMDELKWSVHDEELAKEIEREKSLTYRSKKHFRYQLRQIKHVLFHS